MFQHLAIKENVNYSNLLIPYLFHFLFQLQHSLVICIGKFLDYRFIIYLSILILVLVNNSPHKLCASLSSSSSSSSFSSFHLNLLVLFVFYTQIPTNIKKIFFFDIMANSEPRKMQLADRLSFKYYIDNLNIIIETFFLLPFCSFSLYVDEIVRKKKKI